MTTPRQLRRFAGIFARMSVEARRRMYEERPSRAELLWIDGYMDGVAA